ARSLPPMAPFCAHAAIGTVWVSFPSEAAFKNPSEAAFKNMMNGHPIVSTDEAKPHRGGGGTCRLCANKLTHEFVDLGMTPLCESFLLADQLDQHEPYFPLHAFVCDSCFLVQLKEYVSPVEIFREYAYFSSYSTSWVEHARTYCAMIKDRLDLGKESLVVELASNDGYLLQHFLP